MANVEGGAGLNGGPARAKRGLQKLPELGVGHPIAFDREALLAAGRPRSVLSRVSRVVAGNSGRSGANRASP
jgi:hypothetical protein